MISATALIVDDEPLARRKLERWLVETPWITALHQAQNGEDAVARINDVRPDVLFLDVRMPGMGGLEVLQRLTHEPVTVFTTAYDQFALAAFEARAVDYLLKPFGRRRFLATLERVHQHLEARQALSRMGRSEEPTPAESLSQVFVREYGGIVPVEMGDVERVEARDDYVLLHTATRSHLASMRMHELEKRLDPRRFLRIHRSHIVNLRHVVAFTPDASGRFLVTLRSGAQVFASRSRSRELRRRAV